LDKGVDLNRFRTFAQNRQNGFVALGNCFVRVSWRGLRIGKLSASRPDVVAIGGVGSAFPRGSLKAAGLSHDLRQKMTGRKLRQLRLGNSLTPRRKIVPIRLGRALGPAEPSSWSAVTVWLM
jgi:hypothetical protein